MPRLITITSGSSGVGRTSMILNVSIALAKMDFKVLLVDADMGLSNLDVIMGIMPQKTLEDVVTGDAAPEDIIINTGYRVDLIPASSGLKVIEIADEEGIECISKDFADITRGYDFIMVDAPSGISGRTVNFLKGMKDIIVGITPDEKSLTGAYALIKELKTAGGNPRISVYSSMVKDYSAGHSLFRKLSLVSQRFVNTHVGYIGPVILDSISVPSSGEQVPVIVKHPTSDTARCYRMIASTILSQKASDSNIDSAFRDIIRLVAEDSNPDSVKEISFDEKRGINGLERTMDAILEEQKRTRLLMEKLVGLMDVTRADGTGKPPHLQD